MSEERLAEEKTKDYFGVRDAVVWLAVARLWYAAQTGMAATQGVATKRVRFPWSDRQNKAILIL